MSPRPPATPAVAPDRAGSVPLRRIGHKGADAIRAGNTLASFEAAAEAGVDVIELDVLRPPGDFDDGTDWRRAPAGPARASGPLLIAHDWGDARRRDPLTLAECLEAFTRPPLDRVELNLDLKIAGREDEVADEVREAGLLDRAMVSTMEQSSLGFLHRLEPDLRRGFTVPKTRRDWTGRRWAAPMLAVALAGLRMRLPALVQPKIEELELHAVWAFHRTVTERLAEVCEAAGAELIAWTVDDAARISELGELGVSGVCSNDPRLLAALG